MRHSRGQPFWLVFVLLAGVLLVWNHSAVAVDGPSPQPEKTLTNSIGMKLALVPAGEVMMGSPKDEKDRTDRDETLHRVRITKPFYMGIYEVTQLEYERVTGTNPSDFRRDGEGKDAVTGQDTSRFPVEEVSWNNATAFCRRLGEKERKTYRLPTEAEWEYACRAGTKTAFHFGGELNGRQANCDGNYPYGTSTKGPYLERTCAVGQYDPNGFGLYDMHGNVWEWCADWYGEDYYSKSPLEDPKGPSGGLMRVMRGGGWSHWPGGCRSARRGSFEPGYHYITLGFRVVCES